MRIKKSLGSKIFDGFNYLFLFFMMVITLAPFLHVVFASISDPNRVLLFNGFILYPLGFSLESYKVVFLNPNLINSYKNTVIILAMGLSVNMIMTCLAAYPLSRKGLMLKRPIQLMIIFTMYFGGGMIPTYLVVKTLGLMGTYWAVVLPGAISTYNMIVLRSSMGSVPDSMEESAKLDGANDYTILLRIIIPLVMPTLAVVVLWYGVGIWNAWFNAMLYLKKEQQPISLLLREILIANSVENMVTEVAAQADRVPIGETIKYCVIVVGTLPILLLYPFLQKYFTKGVMVGALKG